jgi:hypothetical protein
LVGTKHLVKSIHADGKPNRRMILHFPPQLPDFVADFIALPTDSNLSLPIPFFQYRFLSSSTADLFRSLI